MLLRFSRLLIFLPLLIGLPGCNHPGQSKANDDHQARQVSGLTGLMTGPVTPINQLQPQGQERPIVLKGRIGEQVPLLGAQVYQLQDDTGSVWVLTRQPLAKRGDEVVIRGQVRYKSIPLAGKEQGSLYVEQQEQLQHTPAKGGSV